MLIELDAHEPERLRSLNEATIAWFNRAMREDAGFGWIAEADGGNVGGLSMSLLLTQPQYRAPRGLLVSLWGLFVEPEWRGRGIATRLVREAVSFAEARDFELVTLHAATMARPIYERLGFEPTSEMRLFPKGAE